MAKKTQKTQNEHDPLLSAIEEIHRQNPELKPEDPAKDSGADGIVDIITFCNDPAYLNLPGNNFNLWLPQKVILKTFYMGTIGNESLQLKKEEWEWLHNNAEDEKRDGEMYEKNCNHVIEKLHRLIKNRNEDSDDDASSKKKVKYFNELQLVLGRRGSKTALASIITVYEAYKLLVINNGDPHEYYNLPYGSEIAIINVALSQDQAGRLFNEVRERLRKSPFFQSRISHPTTSSIRLLTDRDLETQEQGSIVGVEGSVLLLCGHSNPDSLCGHSAIMILFDEIAFFDESGKVKGSSFYERLVPSLAKFYKYDAAKVIMISSPNTRMGIFYKTFEDAADDDTILSFQLPTWCINEDIPYDHPELQKARHRNPDRFMVEYGAQWATGGSIGLYFDEGQVDRCIRPDITPHHRPLPGYNYYLHVDPARGGNNYSAVMIAAKKYTNSRGKRRTRCYLANCWVWRPIPGRGLQFHEIDKQIVQICGLFHPMIVSYDDYHSVQSLQLLKSHGINTKRLSYNHGVKQKIYQNLRLMMVYEPEPELFLYDDGGESSLLIAELKSLRYKRIQRGISIQPDKHGDVNTDDLADCVAGACSWATDGVMPSLPAPLVVRTGFV